MPDMFRYITGRRFTTYGWYPLSETNQFNYFFDLLYAPETIDINSKMFSNDLTFDQYYSPTAKEFQNAAIDTTFTLAPDLKNDITISDALKTLEAFKEKGTFNYTDDLRNNILFMAASLLPPTKINTESLFGTTPPLDTILLSSPELKDILKKTTII